MPRIEVNVKEDHLSRLVTSDPVAGVVELIWNSLDSEADQIHVSLATSHLGAVDELEVEDNGHGMTYEEAVAGFSSLGGSWKLGTRHSKNRKRLLHGRHGKGRWRAFAIGDEVTWDSVAKGGDGSRLRVILRGSSKSLNAFEISEPESTSDPTGTKVRVTAGTKQPTRLLGETVSTNISAKLALYLEQYPAVEITYQGARVDPKTVQAHREEYTLEVPNEHGEVTLVVIEWSIPVDRALYLCDGNGMALEEIDARIQAPGFEFTAYIRWEGFRAYENELLLADLGNPSLLPVLDAARDKLRQHFRERQSEQSRAVVDAWKSENVYPYQGEPADDVEKVERDLFEVVAITAAEAVNSATEPAGRRLSLRLIREALEQDPGSLRRILTEVLELPQDKLDELSDLLDKTTLTAIIAAAKLITGRIDFLAGLEILLFDPVSKKQLLERSQLHRILANETWVFGEEFALTADDESLTTVLKKHIGLLGRDKLAEERPVTDEKGKVVIVDLMLARSIEQARNRREHLVMELKRPTVKIGSDEVTQIKNYAYTVASDERFSKTDVSWDFVLVSNELTTFAEMEASQRDRQPGLLSESEGIRVWVRTWAQMLEACRHRLKFVQDSLKYRPSDEEALRNLREVHAKYLPKSLLAAE